MGGDAAAHLLHKHSNADAKVKEIKATNEKQDKDADSEENECKLAPLHNDVDIMLQIEIQNWKSLIEHSTRAQMEDAEEYSVEEDGNDDDEKQVVVGEACTETAAKTEGDIQRMPYQCEREHS